MIFLGYEPGSKAYHFLRHTHNNSIFISPTATFDEEWFPKCKNDHHQYKKDVPTIPPVPSTPKGELRAPKDTFNWNNFQPLALPAVIPQRTVRPQSPASPSVPLPRVQTP